MRIAYKTADGIERSIGKFGKSTRSEFDEALAALPDLIRGARHGNEQHGMAANELLWHLANEAVNTRGIGDGFSTVYSFGGMNQESETRRDISERPTILGDLSTVDSGL